MGVDVADFDGDGLQDMLVTNFAKDYATFYRNDKDLFFTDISNQMRLKELTYDPVKWGCALFDFDQDADLDILICNGHIYPQVDAQESLNEHYCSPPTLLRNAGGRLADVSPQAGPGMQQAVSARGLALGDIDNDGDLDVLITAIDRVPLLLRNDTRSAGSLAASAAAQSARQSGHQRPGDRHRRRQDPIARGAQWLDLRVAMFAGFALWPGWRGRNRIVGSRLARWTANR